MTEHIPKCVFRVFAYKAFVFVPYSVDFEVGAFRRVLGIVKDAVVLEFARTCHFGCKIYVGSIFGEELGYTIKFFVVAIIVVYQFVNAYLPFAIAKEDGPICFAFFVEGAGEPPRGSEKAYKKTRVSSICSRLSQDIKAAMTYSPTT